MDEANTYRELTRRKFMKVARGGGMAVMAGGPAILHGAASTSTPNPTTFKIGGDLEVNRLGFGAMRITGDGVWGWPKDRAEAIRVLKRTLELGVNLIDTADAYGPETSELLLAEALHPYPEGLVIATKGGLTRPGPNQWVPDGRPEYLIQCVEKSLKRLRLERIDLYQLHRVDRQVPLEDSLGALKKMQEAGKIRHVGLSEIGPDAIARAGKVLPIVTVQNRYNLSDRTWDDALAYCEKEGIGFMPWRPLGGGSGSLKNNAVEEVAKAHGASVYQIGLAWLLARSPVMLPIPGTSSVKHLEENVAAAKIRLTLEEMDSLGQAENVTLMQWIRRNGRAVKALFR